MTKIQLRRDVKANWESVNPILAQGEVGLELDTHKKKIGDGVTAWKDLDYDSGGGYDPDNITTELNENQKLKTKTFIYTQSSASLTWEIEHNMGKFPSVVTVDTAGTNIEGAIEYVTNKKLTIHFSSETAGIAYLN